MPAKRNRFTTFSHTDREQIEALLKTPRPSCRKRCTPPELEGAHLLHAIKPVAVGGSYVSFLLLT